MIYKQKRTKNKLLTSRIALLSSVVIVILIGSFFAYRVYHSSHKETLKPATTPSSVVTTDLSPATSEEQKDSNTHKEASATPPPTNASSATSKKSVTPVIVDASQYEQIEVRSYVPGVIESGGTCTITFTKGSLAVTKSVVANADATTTRCTNLEVNRSEFSQAGTWSVVVSYSSNSAQGPSQARTFEVK